MSSRGLSDAEAHKAFMASVIGSRYFAAGEAQYKTFASRIKPDPSASDRLTTGGAEALDYFGAIAAGMLIAFSIELLLKALAAQRGIALPHGHNIAALLKKLDPVLVDEIALLYKDSYGKENYLAFEFNAGTNPPPGGRSGQASFEQAVDEISDLFVKLRYYHENFEQPHSMSFDFSNLFRIANAIRSSIDRFRGNAVVSLRGVPSFSFLRKTGPV